MAVSDFQIKFQSLVFWVLVLAVLAIVTERCVFEIDIGILEWSLWHYYEFWWVWLWYFFPTCKLIQVKAAQDCLLAVFNFFSHKSKSEEKYFINLNVGYSRLKNCWGYCCMFCIQQSTHLQDNEFCTQRDTLALWYNRTLWYSTGCLKLAAKWV